MQVNTSAQYVSHLEAEAQVGRNSSDALDRAFMVQGRQLMNALRHLANLLND